MINFKGMYKQKPFLEAISVIVTAYPGRSAVTRKEVETALKAAKISAMPLAWLRDDDYVTADSGKKNKKYRIPVELLTGQSAVDAVQPIEPAAMVDEIQTEEIPEIDTTNGEVEQMQLQIMQSAASSFVPTIDPSYVRWGNDAILRAIIRSKKFYPIMITGLSGNGKTMMIRQICAEEGREFWRIQITTETTEADLIGGFRMIKGETVRFDGPVVTAMQRGGVLLLDESTQNNTLMILQPVLEGQPLYIAATGQTIYPAPGFTVISTSNTKGFGDSTGKFVGEKIMNEATLERYKIMLEQPYPDESVEFDILEKHHRQFAPELPFDATYARTLIKWAGIIRSTYATGAIMDIITTRRLTYIMETFAMLGNQEQAIKLSVARFESSVAEGMYNTYQQLSAVPASRDVPTPMTTSSTPVPPIPF